MFQRLEPPTPSQDVGQGLPGLPETQEHTANHLWVAPLHFLFHLTPSVKVDSFIYIINEIAHVNVNKGIFLLVSCQW